LGGITPSFHQITGEAAGKDSLLKKPKIFYGYWILAACFLFLAIGVGCSQVSFSFFIKPLQAAMGWSRTEIMAALTIYILLMGINGPLAGSLVDRYGARKVIPVGALLVATGFVLLSQMNGLKQYYLGYAFIGIGSTGIGPVTLTSLMSHWFIKRRGTAIGIMSTGMGIGGIIFAPFVAIYLIPHLGWSHAYLVLAAILGGLIIPLSLLVIKSKPTELGLSPDGMATYEIANVAEASTSAAEGLSLKMAVATPAFWLLAGSVILNHTHMGVSQSVVPHLGDIGFPVGIAASAISTTSIMSTAGMFFFGWLCDKIPVKIAYIIGLVLIVMGILVLVNIEAGSPVWMVWLYAVVFGFGVSSWMTTMSILTSTTFGLASYGAIFGMLSLFQNMGGSIGPLLAGYLYDSMNTYYWAFIIIMAMVVLAMPLVLAVRRPLVVSKSRSAASQL
jgi:MFS family permease